MKKAVSFLIAVLLLLTVFGAGCSQKPDETGSKEGETVAAPGTSTNSGTSTNANASASAGTTAEQPTEKPELWKLNGDPEIEGLVSRYFEAIRTGDEELLQNVMMSGTDIDPVFLIVHSKIYEEFRNIRTFVCPGLKDGETCLFVLADVKFVNIDTPAVKSYVMYARQDETVQKLRLMTDEDMTEEKKAAEAEAAASGQMERETAFSWYAARFNESSYIMGIYNEAVQSYKDALASDSRLAYYIGQFGKGDFDVPTEEESTTEVIETTPEPTEPTTPAEETTEPTESVEETTEERPLETVEGETLYETPKYGFVTDNGVRIRSTPSTAGTTNVLMYLNFPHRVMIVGETEKWYHIKDTLTEDGTGKAQDCSGLDGYIFKEYIMEYDSQQP